MKLLEIKQKKEKKKDMLNNSTRKVYKKRGEVEGNTTQLNGVPCAWCGKSEGMDFETRFDCEEDQELFTLHKNCYKIVIKTYPETDVLAVLYQAQERRRQEKYGTI